MDKEEQTVAEMMRQGTYFSDARAWYQTIYINIVSERAFFLAIGVIAALTGICAIVALSGLMPLTARPSIVIAAHDINNDVPSLSRMRNKGEDSNTALARFFVLSYVMKRESYIPSDAAENRAFVTAHSDPTTLASYNPTIDPTNAQSLPVTLTELGYRKVQLQSFKVSHNAQPTVATVLFTVIDNINGQQTQSNWQASVGFYYTPMTEKEVVDKDSGDTIIQTEDPQFQVVTYDRQKIQ